MGLFSKLLGTSQTAQASPPALTRVDAGLPDGAWLRASEQAFRERVDAYYGSPETMAEGGKDSYGHQEFGVALFFYRKAIDMLHTAYGFSQMQSRRPSVADVSIVDGFTASLGASLAQHPEAPVDECVREVTHRLRSIATTSDRVGIPSNLYRAALDSMAAYAPDVGVDDVFWT